MQDWSVQRRGDIVACLLLLALSALLLVDDLTLPAEYAFSDMVAFFTPMYSYLGEGLRQFDIRGWNPHQFSGAPFAADPESGWMYLPVMLIFTLLPPGAAPFLVHAFVHLALASLGCYVFARLIGLNPLGAFAAAAAAVLPQLANQMLCCPPLVQVPAWLPWMLVGAELSLRARDWPARFAGWTIAAVAVSQVLAAWIGQGAYNALLLFAAWIGWRTLAVPAMAAPSLVSRLARGAVDSAAMLLLGAGIAAAGLLPRLAFNAVSSIPGGVYQHDLGHFSSFWSPGNILTALASGYAGGLRWYLGAAVLALILVSPVIARRWVHLPFFLAISALIVLLVLDLQTPVHRLLYAALPRFELMHVHSPERILVILPLPAAMLAGAAVDWLPRWSGRRLALAAVAVLPFAAALLVQLASGGPDPAVSRRALIVCAAASALMLIAASFLPANPGSQPSLALRAVPLALIALIVWDPAGYTLVNHLARIHWRWEAPTDLDEFVRRPPAAEFIAAATSDDPARYFGFDPRRLPEPGQQTWGYLRRERDPEGLLVNNRATVLGIDDVQGYNPVHLKRYVEYITALNGAKQDYHETSVLVSGIDSPLLDLLAARYTLLVKEGRGQTLTLLRDAFPIVFEDTYVEVLERTTALPRAFLVHDARQEPRGAALSLIAGGDVDPRRTAVLETSPPELAPPPDGAAESVTFTHREPDRLALRVEAAAPALLVLSEIYDEGWTAAVDGAPAPVLVANHALRAVPVPAGSHEVTLSYQPRGLRAGLAVTIATLAGMAAAGLFLLRRRGAAQLGNAS